jgi:hypothetical protein
MREGIVRLAIGVVVAGAAGCPPPSVVDLPAAQLVIQPTIIDVDAHPSDGKVPVIVAFQQAGKAVQLASSNTVTCNGVALIWNGLGYAARVPIVASGGDLTVDHVRAGVTTPVHVTVPSRPQVTSPTAGASLPRTTSLTITYVAAASAGVRPGGGDGATGLSGNEQPDTGTATLDVSKLKAGPGTVSVQRRFVAAPSGTGFAGVATTYSISSVDIPVTWQ